MDKSNVSPTSFPRVSASDELSSPTSPSTISISTSEPSPTPAPVTMPEEPPGWDLLAAPVPGALEPRVTDTARAGPNPAREHAVKARGQQPPHQHHHHKQPTSPDTLDRKSLPKKSSSSDAQIGKPSSPRKANGARSGARERSLSPRKTERNPSAPAESKSRSAGVREAEPSKERKARPPKDGRASSPRKSPGKGQSAASVARQPSKCQDEQLKGQDEQPKGQDEQPKRSGGQHPSAAGREGKEKRSKEEDGKRRQEREATAGKGEATSAANEARRKEKEAGREAGPQRSHSQMQREKGGAEEAGTLGRKGKKEKEKEKELELEGERDRGAREAKRKGTAVEENKKDPRGSAQVPPCNGNPSNKKTSITPGPWKVPSTSKIMSQSEVTREEN